MTQKEFVDAYAKLRPRHKKFIYEYFKNGFDVKAAGLACGYSKRSYYIYVINGKVRPLIRYLIDKNDLMSSFLTPEWVMNQYKTLYNSTTSEATKLKILENFSRILQLMNENQTVTVNAAPEKIQFNFYSDDEEVVKVEQINNEANKEVVKAIEE